MFMTNRQNVNLDPTVKQNVDETSELDDVVVNQ